MVTTTIGSRYFPNGAAPSARITVPAPAPRPTRTTTVSPGTTTPPAPSGVEATPSATSPPAYTLSQIAGHASSTNCWLIIDRKVFDVTSYLDKHPGRRPDNHALVRQGIHRRLRHRGRPRRTLTRGVHCPRRLLHRPRFAMKPRPGARRRRPSPTRRLDAAWRTVADVRPVLGFIEASQSRSPLLHAPGLDLRVQGKERRWVP